MRKITQMKNFKLFLKSYLLASLFALGIFLIFSACRKQTSGSAVIWYDKTASIGLLKVGSTSLNYYFDGSLIGSSASGTFWTGPPDCSSTGVITIKKDLGGAKIKNFSYTIKDQLNRIVYSGSMDIKDASCNSLQLQ